MLIEKSPLVSVIIPMYNSAQFIPQTLESLLYQTMTNFEVIVIDDCSTDNSVEIVEKFAPRFASVGIALRGIKLSKNTGTPGIPRNVGIKVARGKYIAFLDSDDFYTKTALEELTTLAEKYQADVVYTNDTYSLFNGKALSLDDPQMNNFAELTNPANFSLSDWRSPLLARPVPLPAPILESNNLEERVISWVNWKYRFAMCSNFCRRDFLIDNKIFFSNMTACEDQIFNFACLCLAKNFLCAPNIYYIIRPIAGSLTRAEKNIQYDEKYFRKWFNVIKDGFNEFKKVMDEIPFFSTHEILRYYVLNFFFRVNYIRYIAGKNTKNYIPMFYQLVKEIFPTADVALISALFGAVNFDWIKINELRSNNKKLKAENQKLKRK